MASFSAIAKSIYISSTVNPNIAKVGGLQKTPLLEPGAMHPI
jgi:hypothetical protein